MKRAAILAIVLFAGTVLAQIPGNGDWTLDSTSLVREDMDVIKTAVGPSSAMVHVYDGPTGQGRYYIDDVEVFDVGAPNHRGCPVNLGTDLDWMIVVVTLGTGVVTGVITDDGGATWGTPFTIGTQSGASRCDAAFDGDQSLVVMAASTGWSAFYSNNLAATWQPSTGPTVVPDSGALGGGYGIAAVGNGEFVSVFPVTSGTGDGGNQMGSAFSTDDGATWTYNGWFDDYPGTPSLTRPDVYGVPGKVYAVYQLSTNLFFRTSTDFGANWQQGTTLTVGSVTENNDHVFARDGVVIVGYHASGGGCGYAVSNLDAAPAPAGIITGSSCATAAPVIVPGATKLYALDAADNNEPEVWTTAEISSSPKPTAPPGLTVTMTATETATLSWFPSSNDPNQTVGEYLYIFELVGGFSQVNLASGDGGGIISEQADTSGFTGQQSFRVKARNQTTLQDSDWSCIVVVNVGQVGASKTCGTAPGSASSAGGGGGFLGIDVDQIASDMGTSSSALGWFLGLLLTIGLAAGLFFLSGEKGSPVMGVLGAMLGVGTSTVFGFFPLWFIAFLVFISAAAFIFMRGRQ